MRREIVWFVYSIMLFGCATENGNTEGVPRKAIEVDARYGAFNTLTSKANCVGPTGPYMTEVHSTRDGYAYFGQEYESGELYRAVIYTNQVGYTLSASGQIVDTLSPNSIEIIKGHEFHKIHMMPTACFDHIMYQKDETYEGVVCEQYNGLDLSGNRVTIYYNREEEVIIGYDFQNPTDTSEVIEIKYREWMTSDYGPLAKKIEIIQGGSKHYHFDFTSVEINNADFERKVGLE